MSTPSALVRPTDVPFRRRFAARLVLLIAFPLARCSPKRIEQALRLARRGARSASVGQAAAARDAVCTVSMRCNSPRGCLPRSLAAALVCRLWGAWPTWCTGVRVVSPFTAHAWVEVEGRPVGEGLPDDYFTPLLSVPPMLRMDT